MYKNIHTLKNNSMKYFQRGYFVFIFHFLKKSHQKKVKLLLNEQNASFPNILFPLSMPAYFSLEKKRKNGKEINGGKDLLLISFILMEKLKTHFKKK